MDISTLEDFYKKTKTREPEDAHREIGHFNVFKTEEVSKHVMPYNRRAYYKISLILGKNRAEYADKVIHIEKNALLFATPRIPYNWVPLDDDQHGIFCIFNDEFLTRHKSGVILEELPIYRPGGVPVFQLSDEEAGEIRHIFQKMHKELTSDYLYKYDLLRNYVMELIHYGQKLQPVGILNPAHNAAARVSSLFTELLERQFPVASPQHRIRLRTAKDYADQLAVHVNHLNKVLKEQTGKTTTEAISSRILQEAKILLKQTDWSISEIAYSLGFEELAHFSNFFRKQTSIAPNAFRG
ncbi:helix-turn-helix domain-containing protein [Chitinophaga qingshengii]|uniref:Helix-turn-helix transcriptional regulator n=1 Tax=Chitinophaga qingshengii TaxID=1569794 RepID=A0ABR7TJY5_9BACT|nr:helix-turn-helix transcriptional regulator [Chitinophaga qingshengii]MBC9929846.1 helix-turn-helix transcriptional regulator [Chitinophaga qingshengii]